MTRTLYFIIKMTVTKLHIEIHFDINIYQHNSSDLCVGSSDSFFLVAPISLFLKNSGIE